MKMKTFSCASLGMDCKAVLTAQTEEKLLDIVSIHARDVHGMTAIPPDMIGKIKQLMVNRSPSDAAHAVDRIFEKYNCNKEPECTWRYITEAEMILTGQPSVHTQGLKAA
jgi:predicted small metal-binding protein